MKKIILCFLLLFINLNTFAFEITIQNRILGNYSPFKEQKACFTLAQTSNGQIGIIEDIYDCRIARNSKNNSLLSVDFDLFLPLPTNDPLYNYLVETYPNTRFYYIDIY